MPTVKIEEASCLALDWLTATALGFEPEREGYWDVEQERSVITKLHYQGAEMVDTTWSPTTKWAQGGPIIEREAHNLFKHNGGTDWCCACNVPRDGYTAIVTADGPTPLIAAMRCYCISKLGETAEVPDELLESTK